MRKIDYTNYSKPSDFIHFPQGETVIRVISSGVMSKKHGMRTTRGFIPLGNCTETPECEQCLKGNEAKLKYTWIVYIKSTSEVKILDTGPMIGDAICKLAQQTKKDPQEFDLAISRTGEGLKSKYGVRISTGPALTEEEMKKAEYSKQFLIKKYFKS